jgi:hypothetical protein
VRFLPPGGRSSADGSVRRLRTCDSLNNGLNDDSQICPSYRASRRCINCADSGVASGRSGAPVVAAAGRDLLVLPRQGRGCMIRRSRPDGGVGRSPGLGHCGVPVGRPGRRPRSPPSNADRSLRCHHRAGTHSTRKAMTGWPVVPPGPGPTARPWSTSRAGSRRRSPCGRTTLRSDQARIAAAPRRLAAISGPRPRRRSAARPQRAGPGRCARPCPVKLPHRPPSWTQAPQQPRQTRLSSAGSPIGSPRRGSAARRARAGPGRCVRPCPVELPHRRPSWTQAPQPPASTRLSSNQESGSESAPRHVLARASAGASSRISS